MPDQSDHWFQLMLHDLPISDGDIMSRLRDYLMRTALPPDGRLPPERELAMALGTGRAVLRKALAAMEAEGQLWRHVGKGTFVGSRPIDNDADVAAMARRSNPSEVMGARIAIEPEIARIAAFNATPAQVGEMRNCVSRAESAATWRQYEVWDNRLHRTIAEATQNGLLVGLLDTLNAVRNQVNWGRLRDNPVRPPADHHSFHEHQAIVAAIADRDGGEAAALMRRHLQSVESKFRAR